MMLTFLNLVATSGFLVGIVVGSEKSFKDQWTGDVLITSVDGENEVLRTRDIEHLIETVPSVKAYTSRLTRGGIIETDWLQKKDEDTANRVTGTIAGILPLKEDETTHLSKYVIEGDWLSDDDSEGVVIGSGLLKEYSAVADLVTLLQGIHVGSKIRITVASSTQEYTVRGILKSKIEFVSNRVYMNQNELRKMINKHDFNANEIAVRLYDGKDPYDIKSPLVQNGFSEYARINTASEGAPEFLVNIKNFFNIIGTILGSVSVVVSLITIFIIIYINALTRRRQIGILKGIGVSPFALEVSYIFQALFYVLIGSFIALCIIFLILKPYLDAHPIITPFADIVLVADPLAVSKKFFLVLFVSSLAGYVPARIIIKQNTLNAILGRN
jgi:putative ABC transport system permease protein